ncbi:MAG: hypothetical protein ABJZ55_04990 [Fuerstiella sp.]
MTSLYSWRTPAAVDVAAMSARTSMTPVAAYAGSTDSSLGRPPFYAGRLCDDSRP